jgi:hypothetical protein
MNARPHSRDSVKPIDSDLSSSATHLEKNNSIIIEGMVTVRGQGVLKEFSRLISASGCGGAVG